MRRISFNMTQEQVLNRTKFVTRRLGWNDLKIGERLQAVDKIRTRSAQKLAVIEVVSARREMLFDLLRAADGFGYDGGDHNPYAIREMSLEGFPGMRPLDFVEKFTKGNGLSVYKNNVTVNRIEFRYVDDDAVRAEARGEV